MAETKLQNKEKDKIQFVKRMIEIFDEFVQRPMSVQRKMKRFENMSVFYLFIIDTSFNHEAS